MKLNGKIENLEIKELHFTVFGIFSKNVQNRDITKKNIRKNKKPLKSPPCASPRKYSSKPTFAARIVTEKKFLKIYVL